MRIDLSAAKVKAANAKMAALKIPPPVPAGRAGQLLMLVRELVETSPTEAEGALWAVRPLCWWGEQLGCSTRQVQREIKTLLDEGRVKTVQKRVAATPLLFIREGSPDEKSPEDYARMMRAYLDKKFKPKAGELNKEQVDELIKRSKRNYGCLVQLGKWWGDDALPILKSICENWTDFQSVVHSEIDLAIADAKEKGEKCSLLHVKKAYPSIPQFRWFAEWRPGMVLELHLMAMQAKGGGPNPNKLLAKYGSNDPLSCSLWRSGHAP